MFDSKVKLTVRLPVGSEWNRPTLADEEAAVAAAARSMLRAFVSISSHMRFTCTTGANAHKRLHHRAIHDSSPFMNWRQPASCRQHSIMILKTASVEDA